MSMLDHRQIQLPGGTLTSGADLANRGISPNQYASVAEMEINIQDNLNAIGSMGGLGSMGVPRKKVTYQTQLQAARRSFRLRALALICALMLLLALLAGNTPAWKPLGIAMAVLLVFSCLLWPHWRRPEPWGPAEPDPHSALVAALARTLRFAGGLFWLLVAQLIIAFCCYQAIPGLPAYPTPASQESYQSTQPRYVQKSREDARQENAQTLAPLYQPGTSMSKIYQGCQNKACTMPDLQAFERFAVHALLPATYKSDVCLLLLQTHRPYLIPKRPELAPTFFMTPAQFSDEAGGIGCAVTPAYTARIQQLNQDAANARLYKALPWFALMSLFYGVALYRTRRWK